MSMLQLVIGTAVGFLVAQGALHGFARLMGWLRHGDLPGLLMRVRAMRATPAPSLLSAFIKYAAPVGVSAALITFGIWAASDYLAAKSAHNAEANLFDSAASAPATEQDAPPLRSAALAPPPPEAIDPPASAAPDPYADPEFRVRRKAHRGGAAPSLKETLVQKEETRARNELLRELQQHVHRSQYDCEAADRADKYLKAGLDVWGFASWQVKYFPQSDYRGATLEQCRDIKSVVASPVDLQSAVAQQTPADSEH